MEEKYKEIEISCPVCKEVANIKVPENIFAQKRFGLIKIQVPPGAICSEHLFIVFIDTKGVVRGYEKIDLFSYKCVDEFKDGAELSEKVSLRRLIQLIGLYGFYCLLHATIFNYPSYIMRETGKEDTTNILNIFFDKLLPERHKRLCSVKILEQIAYNKIKIKEKDALVIDSHQQILQTPWNENLKLEFEGEIVKKALEITNEEDQITMLKHAIERIIKEAEFVKDLLMDVQEIYDDVLIEKVSSVLMLPKMNQYRLNLIKDFIKKRYSPKLSVKIKNKALNSLEKAFW